jgi:hypothetical protein
MWKISQLKLINSHNLNEMQIDFNDENHYTGQYR